MAKRPRLAVSQRLRNRLEDDLDIHLPTAPQRIWGEPSGSCRWFVHDDKGGEYLSYHPMSDCVRSDVRLVVSGCLGSTNTKFVSIELVNAKR